MSSGTPLAPSPSSLPEFWAATHFYVEILLRLIEEQSARPDAAGVLCEALFLWETIHTMGFREFIRRYQSGRYQSGQLPTRGLHGSESE